MIRPLRVMFGILLAAVLCGGPAACTGGGSFDDRQGDQQNDGGDTDGGNTDGGSDDGGDNTGESCARASSSRHATYVPAGYTPESIDRVIVLGDSISAGSGVGNAAHTYASLLMQNDDAAWPDGDTVDLTTYFGPTFEFSNFAVGGATTATLRSDQLPAVQAAYSGGAAGMTLAFITIGGNDIQAEIFGNFFNRDFTGARLTNAIANVRAVVEALQNPALFPDGVRIYLTTVYDPSDGAGQVQGCFASQNLLDASIALEVWRERYFDLGRELGFSVVDMHRHFLGHGFHHLDTQNPNHVPEDATRWFHNDCIHPNGRGHHEIRRLFYEAVDCAFLATP